MTDVTDPAFNSSNFDWKEIVAHSPDVIIVINRQGLIAFSNQEQDPGGPNSVVGLQSANWVPPEEKQRYLERIARVFDTGESENYEMAGYDLEGNDAWYASSMAPVVRDGEVVLATIVSRAITERRRTEESIKHALERERQAADQLRRLDSMQRDFTAKVVHDLRTPITIIDGFARTLTDERLTISESERRHYLDLISSASTRLTSLVDDILDVFRIESDGLAYDVAPMDVVQSIRQTIAGFGPLSERMRLEAPDGAVMALADERRHEQIITNLLANALKFSPSGSVVTVRVASDDGNVRVDVEDHGIGIGAEHMDMLFNKFSQVPSPSGAPTGGSGLGLYICKSLLSAQNGSIDVTSELGVGSTFTYRLPLAD